MRNVYKEARNTTAVVGALALALLVGWPFAVIWALNTLFGLAIGYSFVNWLAVVVLVSTLGVSLVKRR